MPNWCNSSYVVTGDKTEVCDLYDKMRSLEERKESLMKNGFGKMWFGNLVTLLGGDLNAIYCRGEWFGLDKDCDDRALRFGVMSAWAEPYEVMEFLKGIYPNLEFYFQAEESGLGYYVTNDAGGEYFPERYYFSEPDDCEPYQYTENQLDDFLRDVGNFLGKELQSLEEAMSEIDAYNEAKEWDECAEIKIFKVITSKEDTNEQE